MSQELLPEIYKLDYSIADSKIKFELHNDAKEKLRQVPYKFGFSESGFGEATYYRTYARKIPELNRLENWHDTCFRVINGIFTIRKWWNKLHYLKWDENSMQQLAYIYCESLIKMHWTPPGRGIQFMGTDYMYERGAMCLYNCAFVEINDIAEDSAWLKDALMSGVGVGFAIGKHLNPKLYAPYKRKKLEYVIADSKEGWVESVRDLIKSWLVPNSPTIHFDYSKIRPYGTLIKGFGGTASGPQPLIDLHTRIVNYLEDYISGRIDTTRLVCDIQNAIGVCVVAGNSRRSAEIAIGEPEDKTFLDLKDYNKYPERQEIGYMSNNSVRLSTTEHFNEFLPEISRRVIDNGEPGLFNLINTQKYGRMNGVLKPDPATGLNPCGEIPLSDKEVCNLAEVYPIRHITDSDRLLAVQAATFYSTTVALYPTHSQQTNQIIAAHRRIGISLTGITNWTESLNTNKCVRYMREAYKNIEDYNIYLAAQAGVTKSIRLTTVKPSGTVSSVVGVAPGMHFPTFRNCMRRIIIGESSQVFKILKDANIPHEPVLEWLSKQETKKNNRKLFDRYADDTIKSYLANECTDDDEKLIPVMNEQSYVFEFPISYGNIRSAQEVSSWEQFSGLSTLQREYADNAVSCTIYFNPDTESGQINHQLAQFAPQIKSVSMMPHTTEGRYPQMPYSGISHEEYIELISKIKPIDWSQLTTQLLVDEKYCNTESCML